MKLTGQHTFVFRGVQVGIGHFWLIVLALTFAHAYETHLFIQSAANLFHHQEHDVSARAWNALVRNGPLFFRGLLPRLDYTDVQVGGGEVVRLYKMNPDDPTTLLVHVAAIACFISMVRFRKTNWRVRIATFVAALLLTMGNWTIGSNWAVAASELKLEDKSESYVLKGIEPNYY